MIYLYIALAVVALMVTFLVGFIMGSAFTKAYLRVNGLLLEEPKPTTACGEGCSCSKNHGSGAEK